MPTRPPLAQLLDLQPHPEGGWYRQTFASPVEVTLDDGRVRRAATLIQFLLPAGECSAWHRVASDEIWLAQLGAVTLQVDEQVMVVGLELAAGQVAQAVVPAGAWQRTLVSDEDALVSCLVSPGFVFEDFQLGDPEIG